MHRTLATALLAVALAVPMTVADAQPVAPSVAASAVAGWTPGPEGGVVSAANVRTFTVIAPSGAPAAGATVIAWVLRRGPEPRRLKPYEFHADVAGRIRLDIPLSDGVIRSRPHERMFNVLAIVVDGGPGVPVTPMLMPFILNLGDSLWPADPTHVEGSVARLTVPSARSLVGDGPRTDASARGVDGCGQTAGGFVCTETTYPESLRAVPVPVADNFGAGEDFVTSIDYRNSRHTTTSTVSGTDGVLLEVRNSATVGNDSTVSASGTRRGVRGGTSDEELRLATQFKEIKTRICGGGACYDAIHVTPDRMTGTTSAVTSLSLHDQMSESRTASLDCGNYVEVDTSFGNSQGRTRELSFEIGVDINAQVRFINMHAATVYENYNEVIDTASYSWFVESNPTYPHHYVYVPGGLANYDASQPDGGKVCPLTSPGNTFTHASVRGDLTPDAPGDPSPMVPPGSTQPVKHTLRRCEAAPDRCGRD
jgi:hypothetical protein